MSKTKNRRSRDQRKPALPAEPAAPLATPPAAPVPAGAGSLAQWFLSRTIRLATAMRKHVQRLLNHQRDILPPQGVDAVVGALAQLQQAIASKAETIQLEKQMEYLETVANKWLRPYPNAAWRENVEVMLVALAVAMGIRTFFLQPFKIPTGSMQPTLYGVTSIPDFTTGHDESGSEAAHFEIPTGGQRVRDWFGGASYLDIKAKVDGELERVNPPVKIIIFSIYQSLVIGGTTHSIFFPPDYGSYSLEVRAGLRLGTSYKKGDQVVRMKVVNGDHLLVDRVSYNLRPPERGEIIVFETKGIPEELRVRQGWYIPPDQFYIKRLVGLGGETLKLGADRHLIVDGKRLDSSTPHFEKVYSFNPKDRPRESHYSGHVDLPGLAPFFRDHPEGVTIPKDHYMVMGDNTMNSLDSRAWGYFPANYLVGKSFFVYWPITERFGWGYHR